MIGSLSKKNLYLRKIYSYFVFHVYIIIPKIFKYATGTSLTNSPSGDSKYFHQFNFKIEVLSSIFTTLTPDIIISLISL